MPLGGRVAARKRHLAPQMALLYYNMLMDKQKLHYDGPVVLVVLDGVGIRENESFNAV